MAKSRSDAESRGCIKHNGREYVNGVVFAQRMGISKMAVTNYVKEGKLTRQKIDGYRGEWFDFAIARAAFVRMRSKQNHVQGGSRKKKDARLIADTTGKGEVKPIPVPAPSTVGSAEVPEIPKSAEGILSYFDPEDPDNADCWEVDDFGEFLMIPHTDPPRHSVDWKKAIDKCTANVRYQQYQRERRELIPRSEVDQTLAMIIPPVTAVLMQMPEKYASRINGRVEEMIGRPMTNEERTIIKALLTDEAEQICHNLQDAVTKAMEKDD